MSEMLKAEDIKRGDRLTHISGVYSIVVIDTLVDSEGVRWFGFLITENCDYTFREAKEASERQEMGEKGVNFVKAKFYETNFANWLSEDRFLHKFTKEKIERVPLIAVDPIPVKTEHILFDQPASLPEEILMDTETKHLQTMAPVVRRRK